MRVRATNLSVVYDSGCLGLDNISFDLSGNVICLIGHNGSGKSTLIKSALNLLVPTKGTLEVLDNDLVLEPTRHMMFSPEMGAVFTDLTVESYIKLWCRLKLADSGYYKKEGSDIIESLQLRELLGRYGRELSKGQRRRVQLGVGFLVKPRVFFLDEPFDGLDIHQAGYLSSLIQKEASTKGFILSSHHMDVVEKLAEQVIVLKEGKLAASGTPAEVCNKLAGRTLLVSGMSSSEILKKRPDLSVFDRGTDSLVVGSELPATKLSAELGQPVVEISTTLAVAMEHHLSKLAENIID